MFAPGREAVSPLSIGATWSGRNGSDNFANWEDDAGIALTCNECSSLAVTGSTAQAHMMGTYSLQSDLFEGRHYYQSEFHNLTWNDRGWSWEMQGLPKPLAPEHQAYFVFFNIKNKEWCIGAHLGKCDSMFAAGGAASPLDLISTWYHHANGTTWIEDKKLCLRSEDGMVAAGDAVADRSFELASDSIEELQHSTEDLFFKIATSCAAILCLLVLAYVLEEHPELCARLEAGLTGLCRSSAPATGGSGAGGVGGSGSATAQEAQERGKDKEKDAGKKEAKKERKRGGKDTTKAKKEADVKARKQAQEQTRKEAEEKARREAKERVRTEAEERARWEQERREKWEAEQRDIREREERERREAAEASYWEAEKEKMRARQHDGVLRALREELEPQMRKEFESRARVETERLEQLKLVERRVLGGSARGSRDDPEMPQEFKCPIMAEMMQEPVFASDGHTYERRAIESWLTKQLISPMTGAEMPNVVVYANHMAKSMIQDFLLKTQVEANLMSLLDDFE
jgi:hypothetical protein